MSADPNALRRELFAEGWFSEDRLTSFGWKNGGYSVWFERWDWHGARCDKVCVHAHTPDLSKMADAVAEAATLARRAWAEFPDSIPRLDASFELVEDEFATRLWRTRGVDDAR